MKIKIGDKVEVTETIKPGYGNNGSWKKGDIFVVNRITESSIYKGFFWLEPKSNITNGILDKYCKKVKITNWKERLE